MNYLFIIVPVVLVCAYLMWVYNSLVSLRNKVREAFSTMDVYLKRRFDLVPNLVAMVKGYAAHEASTLENTTKMRAGNKLEEQFDQEAKIGEALAKLMVVVENYPELKANQNFLDLQQKLVGIEDDIAYSRRYYNGSVREFNNQCETFPANIVAGMFQFKPMPMFVIDERERSRQHVII